MGVTHSDFARIARTKGVLRHGNSRQANVAFLTAAVVIAVLVIDQGIYDVFFRPANVAATAGLSQTSGELWAYGNREDDTLLERETSGESGAHENAKETNLLERWKFLRSVPVVLSGPLPGGTGNQLEVAYEHINIVHKNGFEYHFPSIVPREHGGSIPADVAWDLTDLRKRLPKVHSELPAACDSKSGGTWDVRIEVNKEQQRVHDNSSQPKILKIAGYRNETVVFRIPRYGLEDIRELRQNILDAVWTHSKPSLLLKYSKRSAICLWVEIHAAKPDVSFASSLRPSQRIQRLAMQWPLKTLGVVHFRFDEHACGAGPPPGVDASRHVCVLQVGVIATKWVPVSEYAQKVSQKLVANGVTMVYLTKSKYMPEDAWNNIENAFRNAKMVKVAESAWGKFDAVTLNFLERELATRCRYFLAEARSTWSQTIVVARPDNASTSKVIDLF